VKYDLKTGTFALLLTVLLVTGLASQVRSEEVVTFPTSGQFDEVTTITAPRLSLRLVDSISFKGSDIRVDKTDPTQFIPLTEIETPDETYVYSTLAGTGEKSAIVHKMPPLLLRMDEDIKNKLLGAVKTGVDTYDGNSCDTYTLTVPSNGEQIEFWVNKDPKFPFAVKTVMTDKARGKVTMVELEKIKLSGVIDDSIFVVPASIKITKASQSTATPPSANAPITPSTGANGSK
jgi:hypothetical protein